MWESTLLQLILSLSQKGKTLFMTINGHAAKPNYNLKSKNPEIVIQAIEEISEKGNSSQFTELMELLHKTDIQDIKKRILKLFSELKSTDTIPLMIDALQNNKYAEELKELLTCCWQNGLNYSSYLPLFVDLVINGEFLIAFEAFTVIENMYGKIDDLIVSEQLYKIKKSLPLVNEQKKYLLNELSSIIQNIPEEQENRD
jgi:hypothetical protein